MCRFDRRPGLPSFRLSTSLLAIGCVDAVAISAVLSGSGLPPFPNRQFRAQDSRLTWMANRERNIVGVRSRLAATLSSLLWALSEVLLVPVVLGHVLESVLLRPHLSDWVRNTRTVLNQLDHSNRIPITCGGLDNDLTALGHQ